MSDSEDDYMSVKFLVDSNDDVRPSLLYNREKRKMDLFKKKIDSSNKRQKSTHEIEKEKRAIGLNTAISNENIGFKLLEKMGYKQGESLGKNRSGIKEPIDIVIKQGTSGVGRESHIKEVVSKKQQQKIRNIKQYETQFKLANKERQNLSQIRRDFFKAQKICEELDFRNKVNDPVQDFFWTKETIKKRRKIERKEDFDDTDSSSDDEEFDSYISEENLFLLIDYLRTTHLYCIYCVITGIDIRDLEENCPGPYRLDHDDE
ncbi:unnamed protein product [Phyllotreta striolata]|uniref:G patch domain-containing protein 11 n=1 Tax=Phyllotreta striolata TaxID=444603 RepID=A0A9N9XJY4_PHYSR|nr:unnamed protein product [Phyllotreta striolata]